MRYCKKCTMPDTRPGIKFDKNGVCYPCINAENKKETDWAEREHELGILCDMYRRHDGKHDCIIPVSGGKDSTVQIKTIKGDMGMNPLLLNVHNLSWTRTGMDNFNNMLDRFSCECIALHMNRKVSKLMMRKAFENYGSPTWYWDMAVYVYPLKMAIALNIPLIIYGENINYEYGGAFTEETPSALEQISNDVVKPIPLDDWLDKDITLETMQYCIYPTEQEIEDAKLEPIYLSYYKKWDGFANAKEARKYGFKSLEDTGEWIRQGFIEGYDQIDSPGYLIHPWLKYPKFGHSRVTDITSNLIRNGYISRDYGIELVRQHEGKIDPWALQDFCDFLGYTTKQFFEITDKFYNRELFHKVNNQWILKEPIWEE